MQNNCGQFNKKKMKKKKMVAVPAIILVINPTIQYTIFERLQVLGETVLHRKSSGLEIFIYGALGKICATIVTYPYILAKTRLQIQNSKVNSGIFQIFQQIISTEGFSGLYKGLSDKALASVLTAAILLFSQNRVSERKTNSGNNRLNDTQKKKPRLPKC